MMKFKFFALAVVILGSCAEQRVYRPAEYIQSNYRWWPKDGCVPDNESAARIAEVVWLPIYGTGIYKKKPFRATLMGDTVWVVEGTLPRGYKGGVPYIEIQKSDAKILRIYHGK